ncbi:unnamed protein product [Rhizoctonia solani]|uniref:Uncharacterized protein n=1 Tax=Rhizoctonia solani TaxID=456999 RepID=A0A8H3B0H0_9AGAM|nr:unnamed protein product [Rhizoctonia solani]
MPPKGKEKVKLPDYFERREDGDIRCLACESDWIKRSSVSKHQQSAGHVDSLRIYENRRVERAASNLRQSNAVDLSHPPPNQSVFTQQTDTWVSNDLRHLDINGLDTNNWDDVQFSAGVPDSPPLGSQLDSELPAFDIFEPDSDPEDNEFAMPLPQRIIDSLNQSAINLELLQAQFHNLNSTSNWAPYESKIMFLLDLLDNIPRLRLSTEHLKLIMWVMEEAGCHNIPTFNKLRSTQQQLRNICSVQSHQYQSSKGNVFDMLDIPQLIGRDLSNPIVAPHLVFYPEDSGNTLAESWQADKWKDKIPLDQLTPMYADGNKFYYVNELAHLHNGSYVIPNRWITRDGVLTADCWPVIWWSVPDDEPNSGFCVQQGLIQVPSTAFASNYYDLIEHMEPQSYRFAGPFTSYQRKMPNSLRQLTNNSEELLSCFIKPWCDNVSGGHTKQYQPHNNIYVAHANLPGNLLNQEYFVRFASTSTHTSSLEQFEAIKQQLE